MGNAASAFILRIIAGACVEAHDADSNSHALRSLAGRVHWLARDAADACEASDV